MYFYFNLFYFYKVTVSYLRRPFVNIFAARVSRHPKICDFTRQIFPQKDVPRCQVTMDNL